MPCNDSSSALVGSQWPWALALISAGVTASEIALMQLLSYMQWHHFAYLVVAVALLGFGASGTVLTLWRKPLLARTRVMVPWLAIGVGAGFAATVTLLQAPLLRFDLYLLFVERMQWLRLFATCLLLAVPFFFAGLATSLILTAGVERAGRLYFANLIGAGAGALFGLALLGWAEPTRLTAIIALLPLAAATVLYVRQRTPVGWITTGVLTFGAIAVALFAPLVATSPFKDLAQTLYLPEARVVYSQPSAQGWLQLVAAPALRAAPPADLAFAGRVPPQQAVFVNGNRYGSILVETNDPDALEIFAAGPDFLPWQLGAPRRILLLHEGTNGLATFAKQMGAKEIVLVEPHRGLADRLAARFVSDPSIVVQAGEPRATLASATNAFDLVHFPTAGAFGGSAGLRAIGEEFLFTREAVAAAWRAITNNGAIVVTAWMDHPERTPLRLLATLVSGLRQAGVNAVREHLVAVRGWASVTFLVRRTRFDAQAVAEIRSFCRDHGFDPLLLPGLQAEERDFHHAWDNAAFFTLTDAIVDQGDSAALVDAYPFRLAAPIDDRPYFSQFMRPTTAVQLLRTHGWRGMPFFELGSVIVGITLAILTVLATALILLPLLRQDGRRGTTRGWTLGYFFALGAGFMFFEIVLMMRLIPFLGGPVPAAAVVLASLLFSAGLGSYWSQRFSAQTGSLLAILCVAAVGIFALGPVTAALPFASTASFPARAAVSAVMIAPVACVLGMAFPTGLRLLARYSDVQVPWAWAINSCVSVAAPSIATLCAVGLGYSVVFWLAAFMYLGAALVTWRSNAFQTTTANSPHV